MRHSSGLIAKILITTILVAGFSSQAVCAHLCALSKCCEETRTVQSSCCESEAQPTDSVHQCQKCELQSELRAKVQVPQDLPNLEPKPDLPLAIMAPPEYPLPEVEVFEASTPSSQCCGPPPPLMEQGSPRAPPLS